MLGIEKWLTELVTLKGSDLFITVGIPPSVKVRGTISHLDEMSLTQEQVRDLIFNLLDEKQIAEVILKKELNIAIQSERYGRFRLNVFQQQGQLGAVFRHIERRIPKIDALHLPTILKTLSLQKRGLILIVGGTGQGKSNTMAAMIGHRNNESAGHIVSIEDPIEFIHRHERCIMTQREVGIDTDSFQIALKNTFRQAPDVVVIGEVRSAETMQLALAFAETGHLCISTLHATDAIQALERVIHFYPSSKHPEIRLELALNLRAIVAQQLIETKDEKYIYPAVEVMLNTPSISDRIRKDEMHLVKEYMLRSNEEGMQTFDQSLYKLYTENIISYESALKHADSENDIRLLIKLQNK